MRGSRNKTDQGKVKEECEGNFYQTKSDNNIKVQIQAGLFSRPCRIGKQEDTVDELGINRCNCPATSWVMGGRLYGGEGDYMDMEKVYGEGWLGYYETW